MPPERDAFGNEIPPGSGMTLGGAPAAPPPPPLAAPGPAAPPAAVAPPARVPMQIGSSAQSSPEAVRALVWGIVSWFFPFIAPVALWRATHNLRVIDAS